MRSCVGPPTKTSPLLAEPLIVSTTLPVAECCNALRVDIRNNADAELLSKSHLPYNLSSVFLPPLPPPDGDDEAFVPPSWLLKAITDVVATTPRTPAAPPFAFATDPVSVKHNTELLAEFDYDLTALLEAHQDTTLAYNSEFRSLHELRSIYQHH